MPGLPVHQLRLNNRGLTLPLWCFPGWGRSPRVGNGNLLWYPCLENPMNRGAWWATIPGVSWSRTWLKRLACIQGLEGGTLIPEDCGLIRRGRERSFSFYHVKTVWERGHLQARREPASGPKILTLNFWPPELWDNTFLLFKSLIYGILLWQLELPSRGLDHDKL